ncbi:uncharacterized protein FPRO_13683 [Fusarium proliferatum ET1]|uniref:Uncharacterized protein n=1 Tax=Fusarium proliferatum (strain ET1) TaxID=1227346 RepID=A0A1L7VVM0_FUSPR|nr:uncharacterized protein FPRO_13683 [Fusarium proliferatum ET1]CZR43875.1 uncharacterized protein FPRO_13683 [Fusarium proliferatum ET1]
MERLRLNFGLSDPLAQIIRKPQCAGSTGSVIANQSPKRAPVRWAKYSDDDDDFPIELQEEEQLGWVKIRGRFAQRSQDDAAQVCKCTTVRSSKTVGDFDCIKLI